MNYKTSNPLMTKAFPRRLLGNLYKNDMASTPRSTISKFAYEGKLEGECLV